MSRYLGPKKKIVRRLGELPAFLPSVSQEVLNIERELATFNSYSKKKKKPSLFGKRLLEKQKLRFNYGLRERQLLNYVKKARKKQGATGEILLQQLEMRLDSIVFRAGFASTMPEARQLVNHGHILVNSKQINIPSYTCKKHDLIKSSLLKKQEKQASLPSHLEQKTSDTVMISQQAKRNEINLKVKELLIIEYYSRKL